MKKNRFLRAASGLLIATLVSTCAISGTYAKYVTEGSVSDTARVANFGVVINASGTLYSTEYYYKAQSQNNSNLPATGVTAGVTANTASVSSSNTDNLVAPGTKSYDSGLSFGISGTPEVSVNVSGSISAEDIYLGIGTWAVMTAVDSTITEQNFNSYTMDLYTESSGTYTKVDSWAGDVTYYHITDSAVVDTNNYFPVVYKLTGNTEYTTGSLTTKDAQAVATAVATAIDNTLTATTTGEYKTEYSAISVDYPALTDLGSASGKGLGDLTLSWEWDFDANGVGTYDAQDTILGDLIAQKNNSGTLEDGSVVVYTEDPDDGYTAVTFNDYEVLYGTEVVAYLQTSFNISLTVTQID